MLNVRAVVHTREFDEMVHNTIAGMKSLPKSGADPKRGHNPLIASCVWYQRKLAEWWKARPTVAATGQMKGNTWPKLKPAYVRGGYRDKPREEVPVWGGVGRWRTGRVTRARSPMLGATQRKRSATTSGEWADGYAAVRAGQTFEGKIKGRLRQDGSRYRRSDKQLGGNAGQNKHGLLKDFGSMKPEVSGDGKVVKVYSSKPYAAAVADVRAFHWSNEIAREVGVQCAEYCRQYVAFITGKK